MFADLIATEGVTERHVARGSIGVMALHGGLESGTAEIARSIARGAGCSLYEVVLPDDLVWHVPSTQFDPRKSDKLHEFLTSISMAVSIHGFGRAHLERTVLVGGRNRRFAGLVAAALRHRDAFAVIDDLDAIPKGLRGMHRRNPVNLPERQGIQLELTADIRTGDAADALITGVVNAIKGELRSLCVTG